ncbi:MAG: flagellar protein FlgN [Fibrobacteres bacterium]|nr:flagellar protein FlgN [Fibrobacterota bacterium]
MIALAQKLTAIVTKMTALYDSFRITLIQEQELLVANKTTELKECVDNKNRLAESIASAEEQRLAAVIEASNSMGVKGRMAKFEEIALLAGTSGKELMTARGVLLDVVGKVKALNAVNEQLLNDSMNYIKTAFELVTGKQNRNCGYAMNGMTKSSVAVKRNLVNMQA